MKKLYILFYLTTFGCFTPSYADIERYNPERDKLFISALLESERTWLPDEGDVKDLEEGTFDIDFGSFKAHVTDKTIYVYCIDNKPVGFITYWIIGENNHKMGQITRLAIAPEHRRKGYGKALLEKVLKELTQSHVQKVIIATKENNRAAHQLYEKLHFTKTSFPANVIHMLTLNCPLAL